MLAQPDGSSPVGPLTESARERRLVRRSFLKTLLGTTGLVAASSLLAACGNAATPVPSKPAESKPAEAPKPAESKPAEAAKPAAAAATTAPAAGKPAGAGGRLEMFSW